MLWLDGLLLLGAEVRDDILTKEAQRLQHLLMSGRPNSTEWKHLLNAKRFIGFDEPNALNLFHIKAHSLPPGSSSSTAPATSFLYVG